MTLVYRSNKEHEIKPLHDLGPGSYNIQSNNKNKKFTKSSIFASTTQRDPFDSNIYQKSPNAMQIQANIFPQQPHPQVPDSSSALNLNPISQQQKQQLIRPKKTNDCVHIFKSKIERFSKFKVQDRLTENKYKELTLAQQFKKLLQRNNQTSSKGKLLKLKDKLTFQKQLFQKENFQLFPSIPNWQHSYGYRHDPLTNKWVSNSNPIFIFQQSHNTLGKNKNNCALGPGYYIIKDKPHSKGIQILKNSQKEDIIKEGIVYPNLASQNPIHNTIEESQSKMKLRVRLFGKSQLKKLQQDKQNVNQHMFFEVDANLRGKDKREVLIARQIYRKFGQFIPTEEKNSPAAYLQKIRQLKANESETNFPKNEQEEKCQYFLAKSTRFSFEGPSQIIRLNQHQNIKQLQLNEESTQNSNLDRKSHNCKQPYSLGQKRFSELARSQKTGPGSYYVKEPTKRVLKKMFTTFKSNQKKKSLSPNKNSPLPGPGNYNIANEIAKTPNLLGNAYVYYKNLNKEQLKKYFKQEDCMESLYSNWGRQMNYISKLQHSIRPQQSQETVATQKKGQHKQPLAKIKRNLTESLVNLKSMHSKLDYKEMPIKVNEENLKKSNDKVCQGKDSQYLRERVHPKIIKHLYNISKQYVTEQGQNQFKKAIKTQNSEQLGPGKYQISKQMIKKTFNVTYS